MMQRFRIVLIMAMVSCTAVLFFGSCKEEAFRPDEKEKDTADTPKPHRQETPKPNEQPPPRTDTKKPVKHTLIQTKKAHEFKLLAEKTQATIDYQLKHMTSAPGMRTVVGLKNCGNTCYMNSLLQSLLHSDLGRLATIPFDKIAFGPGINKEESLFNVFYDLATRYNTATKTAISTQKIADARATFMPTLIPGLQADASEYLLFFLARLDQELNAIQKLPADNTASYEERANFLFQYYWEKAGKSIDYSIVKDLFGGFLKSERITIADEILVGYELFTVLPLPFPDAAVTDDPTDPKETSLTAMFAEFEKKELLTDEPETVSRQLTLYKAPKNLIISLKRFRTDPKGPNKKIITGVKYPAVLTFVTPADGTVLYDLYALVLHFGDLDGGHYTARIKNSKNKWFIANDDHVANTNEASSLDQDQSVYVLFYKKRAPR